MIDFHNVNLPKYIEIFAVAVTEFSTHCAITKSGREIRNSNSMLPKRSYILKDCRLSKKQFEAFNNFFYARMGKKFSFRLKDYCDFKVEKQLIDKGDGVVKEFQLVKLYSDPVAPYIRKITKPTSESIHLYLGEEPIVPESIDLELGCVSLTDPVPEESELYASFEFDISVRFERDSYQYSFNSDGTISLDDVKLIEVI